MNLTRGLVQLSFAKIAFPYESITIEGVMRNNIFEFPHSSGGLLDKLGRKLYVYSVQTKFVGDSELKQYKDLWPNGLNKLVNIFDEGRTEDLVLPQLGVPRRAMCTNWTRILRSKFTNGEEVTLRFTEDEENYRKLDEAIAIKSRGFDNALKQLDDEAASKSLLKRASEGLDRILQTASDVLAIKDQFELYSSLLEAKLLSLISMCQEFLQTASLARDIDNFALVGAIQELASQAIAIYKDQQQKGLTTRIFLTTSEMTLSQLSFRIYGTSVRGQDLLALNSFSDPLVIPPGTRVRYYPDE